ncbi:MAG TPA: alpha/beta hydrolase [Nocardioidaceae bacterium]|nr:alpha/beta hydrolase [Nocardioidaceae bacterium]
MRSASAARVAGAGVGALVGIGAAAVVAERRLAKARSARKAGVAGAERLGGLHCDPVTVTAEDGVRLHAEIDQPSPQDAAADPARATVVFVHGYTLNLDCWHFQRRHLRQVHRRRRAVFYDQRSHGRSERSSPAHATVDQLGRDLLSVMDALAPDEPVVLVGHSMGGMAIIALAEQHPELFGSRVVGAALISTTAGGLHTSRALSRLIPDRVGALVAPRLVAGLARVPELVDTVRRRGSNIGFLVADRFAFGDDVPASYVEFVDEMIAATPFEVLAEFYPQFDALDKFAVLETFAKVPTTIVTGTGDRLTSVGHSRKMASRIDGARLVECEGAGHMVILECSDRVNAALDELCRRADRR